MKCEKCLILVLLCLAGCTSRTISNTPHTAIEQLLLSTAVDNAISKVQFSRFAGKRIYLDFSNLQAYDSEYVKSSIRSRIAEDSIVILDKAESADLALEVASGALGNEYKSTLLGIPALPIPGSPVSSPDFHLWKKVEQDGIAKLLLTVYSDNKAIYSNHYYGKAERDETFFLWIRFQPKDDIREA